MLVTCRQFIGEAIATLTTKLNSENTLFKFSPLLYTSLADYLY